MERDMKSPITQFKHGKQQITQIVHRTTRTYKTMLIKRDILVLDPYKLLWWFGSLIKALHHHHNFRPASQIMLDSRKPAKPLLVKVFEKPLLLDALEGAFHEPF